MRAYSNNVKLLMSDANLAIFYLVHIKGRSTDLRHTTLPYDITIPSIGEFFSGYNLNAVEAPRQSSVVDRETYKITYSDNDYAMAGVFDSGLLGSKVTVYIGFMNSLDQTLSSSAGNILPGRPLNAPEDLIIAYRGAVDTHAHTVETSGEVTALIECSSPMADLGLVKVYLTTPAQAHRRDSDDACFDQVFSGHRNAELAWGKIRG